MSNLIIQNKDKLIIAIKENSDLLQSLSLTDQKDFQENLLELASNDYLVSTIQPKEIIRFALSITKLGLNVNPAYKEVYIVPFNTKVRNVSVMLPQAIIPLKGLQEMAYNNGFYLRLHGVYKIDEEIVSEKDMQRHQQVQLNTSNPNWVEKSFVGFDVVLEDLKNEIPIQTKFVEVNYLRQVTKTLKDERFKIQTWQHKAARKAFNDFLVPRNRQIVVFTEVDHLNNLTLEEGEKIKVGPDTLKQLGLDTVQENGMLVIKGNTYGKTEYLKQLGFQYHNKSWVKPQEEVEEAQVVTETELPANNEISPKKRLFSFMFKHGLKKEQMGEFVSEVLGLIDPSAGQIEEVLSDERLLIKMIEAFKDEPVLVAS